VQWFIRDGNLQILSSDETTGESSILFSTKTGNLIGIPIKKDNNFIEMIGLISPSLRPGKPFRIESESINGNYITDSIEFIGDTGYETQFYVKVTGKVM
jgi:hypothetical protein